MTREMIDGHSSPMPRSMAAADRFRCDARHQNVCFFTPASRHSDVRFDLVRRAWAHDGVVLEGGGLSEVALPLLMLSVFAAAFAFVALTRFRFEETKIYYG